MAELHETIELTAVQVDPGLALTAHIAEYGPGSSETFDIDAFNSNLAEKAEADLFAALVAAQEAALAAGTERPERKKHRLAQALAILGMGVVGLLAGNSKKVVADDGDCVRWDMATQTCVVHGGSPAPAPAPTSPPATAAPRPRPAPTPTPGTTRPTGTTPKGSGGPSKGNSGGSSTPVETHPVTSNFENLMTFFGCTEDAMPNSLAANQPELEIFNQLIVDNQAAIDAAKEANIDSSSRYATVMKNCILAEIPADQTPEWFDAVAMGRNATNWDVIFHNPDADFTPSDGQKDGVKAYLLAWFLRQHPELIPTTTVAAPAETAAPASAEPTTEVATTTVGSAPAGLPVIVVESSAQPTTTAEGTTTTVAAESGDTVSDNTVVAAAAESTKGDTDPGVDATDVLKVAVPVVATGGIIAFFRRRRHNKGNKPQAGGVSAGAGPAPKGGIGGLTTSQRSTTELK